MFDAIEAFLLPPAINLIFAALGLVFIKRKESLYTESGLARHPFLAWFTLNAGALTRSGYALHEYLGLIWYRIRY